MTRMLGLRNIVCTKDDWYYLVFYDIDREITESEIRDIDEYCRVFGLSYILYKTKHGCHFVGLSPLDKTQECRLFMHLKNMFKSYYSGNVIRLSQKQYEKQELIKMNISYGEVIPNLYNLYAKRFNYNKLPWIKETAKYLLVFEKYRSVKE